MSTIEGPRPTQADLASTSMESSERRERYHNLKATRRLNRKLNRVLGLSKETEHDWDLFQNGEKSGSWYDFRRGIPAQKPDVVTVVGDLVIGAANMSDDAYIPLYSLSLLEDYPSPENPTSYSITAEIKNKADLGKLLQERAK